VRRTASGGPEAKASTRLLGRRQIVLNSKETPFLGILEHGP
jgi:hypothetical protein